MFTYLRLCEGNESHAVSVDVKHNGRRRRTTELGRWAWALIPYPTLPPSLISLVVSVDAKYHGRRKRRTAELRSCVKKVGQGSRSLSHSFPSLINLVVSVDAKYHERRKRRHSFDWNYPTLAAWPASPCAGAPPTKTVQL